MARRLPPEFRVFVDGIFDEEGVGTKFGTDWLAKMAAAMEEVSGLAVAQEILERHKHHFSAGTWTEFMKERLTEAMADREFGKQGIANMLTEMEEHGRQHVFLFKLKQGIEIGPTLNPKRVKKVLEDNGHPKAFDAAPDPNTPVKLKLVHARIEDGILVFKALESKESISSVEKFPLADGREVLLNVRQRKRRIKMGRLHPDGLLEVRLGAVSTGTGDRSDEGYSAEAERFLDAHRWLVERSLFDEVLLADAKEAAVAAEDPFIRVPQQGVRGIKGGTVVIRAPSRDAGIADDDACMQGLRAAKSVDGSTYGRSEIHFLPRDGVGLPKKNLNVFVWGKPHEFYTRRHSTRADFDYVLGELRRLGKF